VAASSLAFRAACIFGEACPSLRSAPGWLTLLPEIDPVVTVSALMEPAVPRRGVGMDCGYCGFPTYIGALFCPACFSHVGYPNVRLAQQPKEKAALSRRMLAAEMNASSQDCSDVLNALGSAALATKAVLARSLRAVDKLVRGEPDPGFHAQVNSGSRIPEDNLWDRGRTAAESTVLPYCYDSVIFAALSLDGLGLTPYGPFFIILKEAMIAHRSSVFEENPFIFCQRHKIYAGSAPPDGYRASWGDRDKLVKAKLASHLSATTNTADFSSIILKPGLGTADGEFVEVHIYGPIHARAIERVIGPKPRRGPDLGIWKSVDLALRRMGASLEAL
jgi:hypothetical protein